MQPDHLRIVVADFKSEMLYVKAGSLFGVARLNQNMCSVTRICLNVSQTVDGGTGSVSRDAECV